MFPRCWRCRAFMHSSYTGSESPPVLVPFGVISKMPSLRGSLDPVGSWANSAWSSCSHNCFKSCPKLFFHKEPWLIGLLCNTAHPCSLGNYSRAPRASLARPLAGFLSSKSPGRCLSHPEMLQVCSPEGRNGAGRFSRLPQHIHTTKAQPIFL